MKMDFLQIIIIIIIIIIMMMMMMMMIIIIKDFIGAFNSTVCSNEGQASKQTLLQEKYNVCLLANAEKNSALSKLFSHDLLLTCMILF